MEKRGNKLSLLTLSVLAFCLMVIAYVPALAASLNITPHFKTRTGIHFDMGVQGSVGFSSANYEEANVDSDSSRGVYDLFQENISLAVDHGPNVSPAVFGSVRYYLNRSFIDFQLGDMFTSRELLNVNYFPHKENIVEHDVHVELKTLNTLYGKLSWGRFITPNTDFNLSVLGLYDRCRLTYDVTGFNVFVDPPTTLSTQYREKLHLRGYGLGMGVEHYLSDYLIVAFNYTFMQHNSLTKELRSVRFGGSTAGELTLNDKAVHHINLGDLYENILSLSLAYEI
jgi:hypothetical protein